LRVAAHVGGYSFIFPCLAGFASLGIVLQAFISKEQLLSGTEYELLAAIYTPQNLVRVLVHTSLLMYVVFQPMDSGADSGRCRTQYLLQDFSGSCATVTTKKGPNRLLALSQLSSVTIAIKLTIADEKTLPQVAACHYRLIPLTVKEIVA